MQLYYRQQRGCVEGWNALQIRTPLYPDCLHWYRHCQYLAEIININYGQNLFPITYDVYYIWWFIQHCSSKLHHKQQSNFFGELNFTGNKNIFLEFFAYNYNDVLIDSFSMQMKRHSNHAWHLPFCCELCAQVSKVSLIVRFLHCGNKNRIILLWKCLHFIYPWMVLQCPLSQPGLVARDLWPAA